MSTQQTTTKLLVQNAKMVKSSKETGYRVLNFGIPAYRAADGSITCPMAGSCGQTGGCYALQGTYTWTPVKAAYEYRYAATKEDNFVPRVVSLLAKELAKATKAGLKLVIRIHDSGDFYSLAYFQSWMEIARAYEGAIIFYAYTKMVNFIPLNNEPNLTLIASEGGLLDHKILQGMRHSRVFGSHEELVAAGYDDATENDTVAFLSKTGLVGLVYHGYKSKTWVTTSKVA